MADKKLMQKKRGSLPLELIEKENGKDGKIG